MTWESANACRRGPAPQAQERCRRELLTLLSEADKLLPAPAFAAHKRHRSQPGTAGRRSKTVAWKNQRMVSAKKLDGYYGKARNLPLHFQRWQGQFTACCHRN